LQAVWRRSVIPFLILGELLREIKQWSSPEGSRNRKRKAPPEGPGPKRANTGSSLKTAVVRCEMSEEGRNLKAAKSDSMSVPMHLWDWRLNRPVWAKGREVELLALVEKLQAGALWFWKQIVEWDSPNVHGKAASLLLKTAVLWQ
jgi:hypothetical protein